MKKQLVYIVLMAIGGAGLFSCSQKNIAQNQEYDDLYYTSADRKAAIEAQPIAHRGSASGYSDQNFRQNGELVYEEENFSARKVNPEYISRYNVAEDDTIVEEAYDDNEYFVEGYDQQNQQQRNNASNVRYNNYYGGGFNNFGYSPFYDPFMMGGFYDPFMMSPFMGPRFMRPGISIGFGMSFGFGNAWGMGMYDPFWGRGFYNPYRFGMMGMYDPFWGGGFYSPWGMGMNSYYMGYNRGFYNGMAFNRYYMEGNSPIRNTVSAPRMSRSSVAGTSSPVRSRTLTRATANNAQNTSRANARMASNTQDSYYSRSRRSVTEQTVSRSAAESTRRSIDGAAYSRNTDANAGQRTNTYSRTAPGGTDYNRSTSPARSPQYRTTSPSDGNYRTAPSSPSRSSSPQYRSAPSTPSRSTQPQYRSQPQYRTPSAPSPSRSGGSYSPSSTPSRSSSTPSGGSSSPSRRGGR